MFYQAYHLQRNSCWNSNHVAPSHLSSPAQDPGAAQVAKYYLSTKKIAEF